MRIGKINTKNKVFIIAEIGNNHEGSFKLAKKMINKAATVGVDAVKFQTFLPEHLVSFEDQSRLNKLRGFQLSYEQFKELSKIAKKKGLIFFSTPLDIKSAKFLNTIQPIFKIASGDNNFYPLIDTVAKFGKSIIVSTGVANIDEIQKVYNKILKAWSKKKKNNQNLALLHCVSSYPVPNEQANLASISYLKKFFPDVIVGYSDHTVGINAAVLSVVAGARIVEKHFTLDKNLSDFRDHKLSADPEEMRLMVNKIREAEKMIGKEEKKSQLCEKEMNIIGRRSIAVARNLKVGTKLSSSDLTWVRPGKGFSPGNEKKIIGKQISRSLKMGEIIMKSDLK
ncbi:N-acetylneuraminate synthase family protein [Candidatus Pelagibacter bacterium]|jgi:N,N'-diacetyllegionaminate synthase|nr:N-acetylneuraminate synthase family protein [Candidatus Pelagibacter bacterium]